MPTESAVEYISGLPNVPNAVGPYSTVAKAGDLYFLSGQVGITPDGTLVSGGIEAQTRQVLQNLTAALAGCELGLQHVLKVTVYLTDIENFPAVNAIYSEVLGNARPARSTVGVAALPLGALVEMDIVAAAS